VVGQDGLVVTYVGFLRAINLGAKRKFPKEAIVRATEAAGFSDVATYINTGNVRFDTTLRSRARIEAALEEAYLAEAGFEVPTIVFTTQDLKAIAAHAEALAETLGECDRHYVSLLKEEPGQAAVEAMEAASTAREVARVRGRAVHLRYHGASYGSDAQLTNVQVEKLIGVATNRNLTVIRALAEKWC
jgi:uncharacterized protein (DUF1697 family)